MKEIKKIMMVGYGSACQYALDFITRNPNLSNCEIVITSIQSEEEVTSRINTTLVSAQLMTKKIPKVRYVQMDLTDHNKMVKILKKESPDLISYSGRFISGIKYGAYSYPNKLGYGVWLPLAFPLIYRLCKAVKEADLHCTIINTSFPDGVVPLLWYAGFTNVIGAGNLNHLIPRVKMATGSDFVLMAGAHYLNTYVSKEGNPRGSKYYLGYMNSEGKFVSNANGGLSNKDCEDIFAKCNIPLESGHTRNLMIASDIANLIDIIVTGSNRIVHVPGVLGLPGGYPATYDYNADKFVWYIHPTEYEG